MSEFKFKSTTAFKRFTLTSNVDMIKVDLEDKEPQRDEMTLDERRRAEAYAIVLNILGFAVFGVSNFQLNVVRKIYPQSLTPNIEITLRSFGMVVMALVLLYSKGLGFPFPNQIKSNWYLFLRGTSNYVCFLCLVMAFDYLRFSTVICFSAINPVILVFLAVCLLGETFRFRYIVGIVICFFGVSLLIFNEKRNQPKPHPDTINTDDLSHKLLRMLAEEMNFVTNQPSNVRTIIGVILGLSHAFFLAFNLLYMKILSFDKELDIDQHIFYVGLNNFTFGMIHVLIFGDGDLLFKDKIPVLLCISNAVLFAIGTRLLQASYARIDAVKLTSAGYVQIIFAFLLGGLFLKEPIGLLDVVGSLIIFGYNTYNAYYPPVDDNDSMIK